MYPKYHFVFLINWKTKFKIIYLNFVFTSIRFLRFYFMLNWFYFEFLMPSFDFHFHKENGKRNTVCLSFFVFIKGLKNELLKQININFMIIVTSMVYTFIESKFVWSPLRFPAVQWWLIWDIFSYLLKIFFFHYHFFVLYKEVPAQ